MPKEYITYPNKGQVTALQESLGMPNDLVDGRIGSTTRAFWDKKLENKEHDSRVDVVAPLPMVGLHWDGKNGTIQLSLDIDWDVLQEMVHARQALPEGTFADDNSFLRNRVTFYTGSLNRNDMQQLVRTARRARNAVYGADE